MQVVVTGATGFVGQPLCSELQSAGHTVTVLSRNAERAQAALGSAVKSLAWGSGAVPAWKEAVAKADAVLHLAGESVADHRWTDEVKARLMSSRVETTRALVDAMQGSDHPGVFVSAAAIGYYGNREDETVTEESAPGSGFLAEVCIAWEAEARKAEALGIRVARMRIGVVLGNGGPLQKILYPLPVPISPWKWGMGGPIGNGRQWLSWIHIADAVGLLMHALTDPQAQGAINVVAPNPVRNRELAQAIGRVLHRPALLPIPAFALRLILGGFADELLTGQRVLPTVAERLGYRYRYPDIASALKSLLE